MSANPSPVTHPSSLDALARSIKRWGSELGFQQVGIAGYELGEAETRLLDWLASGYHGEMKYMETAVTHMNLKSFVARVTKDGDKYKVLGVVLNDGTPIKSVEVKVDEGPWQPATMDPSTKEKYGWKLFNYTWTGATPGAHTLVSRATDVNGKVQPTEQDLAEKKSFLEQNSQAPRKVMIS